MAWPSYLRYFRLIATAFEPCASRIEAVPCANGWLLFGITGANFRHMPESFATFSPRTCASYFRLQNDTCLRRSRTAVLSVESRWIGAIKRSDLWVATMDVSRIVTRLRLNAS